MAKRGPKPGFTMTVEHRTKIQNSAILNSLIEHAEGRRDMTPSQVTAGLGLLKKVMPDLSAVDLAATVQNLTQEDALDALDDKSGATDQTPPS